MTAVTLGITTPKNILGQAVYTKETWAGAWVAQPHMFATQVNWASNPTPSSADLYYRYGRGVVALASALGTLAPFTFPDFCYAKIELDAWDAGGSEAPVYWHGVIGSMVDQRGGSDVSAAPQGTQSFQAIGLEWLLERTFVKTSKFLSNSVLRTANRGFSFNQTKNRSNAKQSGTFIDGYVFSDEGNDWSTRDIVEYLLAFHAPKNTSGVQTQEWILSDPTGVLPIGDAPLVHADHQSVWLLLNQLISRQRGMGFQIYLAGSQIILLPHSFASSAVALPSGDTLPANNSPIELSLTADRGIYAKTVDRSQRCTQVKLIGARAIHCFSAQYGAGGFARDWTTTDEFDYRAGGSNHPDYPQASEVSWRQRFTTLARELPNFPNVFRKFGVPGLATDSVLNIGPRRLFLDDVVIEQSLPLHQGFDYVANNTPTHDRKVPYQEPFIILKVPSSTFPEKFIMGSRNRAIKDNEGADLETDDHQFTVTVESIKSYAGMHIDPAAFYLAAHGAPRHVIDGPNWTEATKPLPEDVPVGLWDYHQAIVTLAAEWDYYCEVEYPFSPTVSDVHMIRIVDMGSEFQLHFLAANTVVGLDDNGEQFLSGVGRYIRDDREKLEELAVLAWEWYSEDRTAINLQTQHFTNLMDVGDLITTVDGVTVNSVITSITLKASFGTEAKQPVATYETAFAEFDVLQAHKSRRLK